MAASLKFYIPSIVQKFTDEMASVKASFRNFPANQKHETTVFIRGKSISSNQEDRTSFSKTEKISLRTNETNYSWEALSHSFCVLNACMRNLTNSISNTSPTREL